MAGAEHFTPREPDARAEVDTHALPPPRPTPRARLRARRRRRRVWVLAGLGSLAAVGVVAAERSAIPNPLTHKLLSADFDHGAQPFLVGQGSDYRLDVIDGTYQIQANVTTTAATGPAISFATFVRTAYTVDIAADVVAVDDPSGEAVVGIGCFDLPETNGHGYSFDVAAEDYIIAEYDHGVPTPLTDVATTHTWPATGQHLRLSCYVYPTGAVQLHGYLDGIEVASATDQGGYETYNNAAVTFAGEHRAWARFDNVTATVPDE